MINKYINGLSYVEVFLCHDYVKHLGGFFKVKVYQTK